MLKLMDISPNLRETRDDDIVTMDDLANTPRRVRPALSREKVRNQRYSCSSEQQRIWNVHNKNPQHASLNMGVCLRFEGNVAHADLENAFRIIISRQQVLRTCFEMVGDEVVQDVASLISFDIPSVDLTKTAESNERKEIERYAHAEVLAQFDLHHSPLLRANRLCFANGVSVLLVTLHHIICDAESVDILLQELNKILSARTTGGLAVLPELPVNYADFTEYQLRQAKQYDYKKYNEFWVNDLKDFRYFQVCPDRSRPLPLSIHKHILAFPMSKGLVNGITRLGQNHGATLHVTMITLLLTLLHRYTSETDITIGNILSDRDLPGTENLVGLFSHISVVRADLSGDPGFASLLVKVQKKATEIFRHPRVTPDNITDILKIEIDSGRNPLFSVNFTMGNSLLKKDRFNEFKIIDSTALSTGVNCDLNFSLVENTDEWNIACHYDEDLFEAKTIIGMLYHFKKLMNSVLLEPNQCISQLSMLDRKERRELIDNDDQSKDLCLNHETVLQLFKAQVLRTPDDTAVVFGERQMTYHEIDIASNQLAWELRIRGVEIKSRVAVFLDRSPDLIVALLAILKSGGAYIPLDPAYPAERLQHVFENSLPTAIITCAALAARLLNKSQTIIVLDAESILIARQCTKPLEIVIAHTDPAYIIYTSGSTGRPKGVVIPHGAMTNFLNSMRSQPGLSQHDTLLAVTTISFDIAVLELFLPLIVGARVIMAREQAVIDGAELLELIQHYNVTCMQATPVTWQLLLEAGWHGNPHLKMLCGGEALSRRLAERLIQCGGELWNMYGPTETTVWSSVLRVVSDNGPVLIGPPIANTQFYVLGAHRELLPHGAPGELYIGGDGVALGYFDLPEVTKMRFIPDTFRNTAGAMLYRTGDNVRRKTNGQLEYLGRSDNQIKLRGYRIELGEIEAVLLRHANVVDAVAVLGQDQSGEAAIFAYVVLLDISSHDRDVFIDTLRSNILQSLPTYMCPAFISILDELPRTPNRKIDRLALPIPALVVRSDIKSLQPLSGMECKLVKIWGDVLGIDDVATTANFFELGGTSLHAAKLLSRIEIELGQRLSLLSLFNVPNIKAQAKLLTGGEQREYDFRQVVQLNRSGSNPPFIAIHNTGVYYYNLSRHLGTDQPLVALQLFDPAINRDFFPLSIEAIATEYVQLIHKIQPSGPYNLFGWCVGGVVAFEVARQLTEIGEEVSLLAMIDTWAPGHSARIAKWRAKLADYSYRWQLISADWHRVRTHQQNIREFLRQRTIIKKFINMFEHNKDYKSNATVPSALHGESLTAEQYDNWLLSYLEAASKFYQPQVYSGKITLLCSEQEPRGLFLDPKMGWGDFTKEEVEISVIDGDHFTMFKGHGLKQIANHLAKSMEVYQ